MNKINPLKIIFSTVLCLAAASIWALSPDNTVPTDEETMAIMLAVNNYEIAAADLAIQKTAHPEIKAYAEMLKSDHSKNLEKLTAISKEQKIIPAKTQMVISFQDNCKKEEEALSLFTGNAFDIQYINAMVSGHAKVLDMVDNILLKNVQNAALKNQLLETKPRIEIHLKEAQAIQKKIG